MLKCLPKILRGRWFLSRLVIITNPESANGFRLAGVEVFEAGVVDEAKKYLTDFINDDSIGIVAIDEDLMEEIDERLKDRIDKLYKPVVIPIPPKKTVEVSDTRTAYVQSIIKRAVGFDIKLG